MRREIILFIPSLVNTKVLEFIKPNVTIQKMVRFDKNLKRTENSFTREVCCFVE